MIEGEPGATIRGSGTGFGVTLDASLVDLGGFEITGFERGVYVQGGDVWLYDLDVHDNTCGAFCGAAAITSTGLLTITDVAVHHNRNNNTALGSPANAGLQLLAGATIDGLYVYENESAGTAGGLALSGTGTFHILDLHAEDNVATDTEERIRVLDLRGGDLTLARSTVRGNTSPARGPAIYLDAGVHEHELQNVLVADNAWGKGGGIELYTGALRLEQVTFAGNSAPQSEPGHVLRGFPGTTVTVHNSLVAGTADAVSVAGLSSSWSNWFGTSLFAAGTPNVVGANGNQAVDPQFQADYVLGDTSPLQDAGDPTTFDVDQSVAQPGCYGGPDPIVTIF